MKNSNGNFPAKRWAITKIAKTAGQNIESLDLRLQQKILLKLHELQVDPFRRDVKKIQGKPNIYRARLGNYRLYFRLIPESRSIEILLFESRSAIKKKSIQRLPD